MKAIELARAIGEAGFDVQTLTDRRIYAKHYQVESLRLWAIRQTSGAWLILTTRYFGHSVNSPDRTDARDVLDLLHTSLGPQVREQLTGRPS